MEFPHLGRNCSEVTCKQLDFLPVKCDACSNVFCREHYRYGNHSCPSQYLRDKQVPVCPLCSRPIPLLPGEVADVKVGAHIDTDCQSDPARERRGKVYMHKCNMKGCKVKEIVPVQCSHCRQNYCLRHRHETDHSCSGFQGTGKTISNAGAAAVARSSAATTRVTPTTKRASNTGSSMGAIGRELDAARQSRAAAAPALAATSGSGGVSVGSFQGGMTEEEALSIAMADSLQDATQQHDAGGRVDRQQQEEQDLALARALAASDEDEARRQRQHPRQQQHTSAESSRCHVS